MVLALFETPAGFALFRLADPGKLEDADSVAAALATPESALSNVAVAAFRKFKGTADAIAASTGVSEGALSKPLRKFLKSELVKKTPADSLLVADTKLGSAISKKLGINVVPVNASSHELFRGLRTHMSTLLADVPEESVRAMALGLSHSLSRHRIKISPEKVDAMIVQAVGLMDELDKEINTYAMRLKEWYGWHFPEMSRVLSDGVAYAKVVLAAGFRTNIARSASAAAKAAAAANGTPLPSTESAEARAAPAVDLATILPEDVERDLIAAAAVSTGTEITEEDLATVQSLARQVVQLHTYRQQLSSYLTARMQAIAPNLTALVGELVGARLIAHAGSLMTLARNPASTIQIMGAERALFRALKAKKDTPKYGLLYHASLVSQAQGRNKGKVARLLATKAALSVRVDALSEGVATPAATVGTASRVTVEKRLRELQARGASKVPSTGLNKTQRKHERPARPARSYDAGSDFKRARTA